MLNNCTVLINKFHFFERVFYFKSFTCGTLTSLVAPSSYWEKNSHNYKIAQTQNWKCPICGEPLFNGEELNTHHIVPVAQGGRDDIENLQHLHHACHKQEHSKTKSTRLK
ncbi:HNH endonuclease [uncultured Nostoc sp.]|uniref:HNH endonuclease n=1 Tax=uncultured Nostoc sp. TaxID=340711 RepID=UPI0035CBE4E5